MSPKLGQPRKASLESGERTPGKRYSMSRAQGREQSCGASNATSRLWGEAKSQRFRDPLCVLTSSSEPLARRASVLTVRVGKLRPVTVSALDLSQGCLFAHKRERWKAQVGPAAGAPTPSSTQPGAWPHPGCCPAGPLGSQEGGDPTVPQGRSNRVPRRPQRQFHPQPGGGVSGNSLCSGAEGHLSAGHSKLGSKKRHGFSRLAFPHPTG